MLEHRKYMIISGKTHEMARKLARSTWDEETMSKKYVKIKDIWKSLAGEMTC